MPTSKRIWMTWTEYRARPRYLMVGYHFIFLLPNARSPPAILLLPSPRRLYIFLCLCLPLEDHTKSQLAPRHVLFNLYVDPLLLHHPSPTVVNLHSQRIIIVVSIPGPGLSATRTTPILES